MATSIDKIEPQGLMALMPEVLQKLPFHIQLFILGFVAVHIGGIFFLLASHFLSQKKAAAKAKFT
jgi:hypothetical protein